MLLSCYDFRSSRPPRTRQNHQDRVIKTIPHRESVTVDFLTIAHYRNSHRVQTSALFPQGALVRAQYECRHNPHYRSRNSLALEKNCQQCILKQQHGASHLAIERRARYERTIIQFLTLSLVSKYFLSVVLLSALPVILVPPQEMFCFFFLNDQKC